MRPRKLSPARHMVTALTELDKCVATCASAPTVVRSQRFEKLYRFVFPTHLSRVSFVLASSANRGLAAKTYKVCTVLASRPEENRAVRVDAIYALYRWNAEFNRLPTECGSETG